MFPSVQKWDTAKTQDDFEQPEIFGFSRFGKFRNWVSFANQQTSTEVINDSGAQISLGENTNRENVCRTVVNGNSSELHQEKCLSGEELSQSIKLDELFSTKLLILATNYLGEIKLMVDQAQLEQLTQQKNFTELDVLNGLVDLKVNDIKQLLKALIQAVLFL